MTRNENCTSSCKTQDHNNYGDCIRQNTPMFNGVTPTKDGWDQSKVKRDEKELNAYYSAVRQGMERHKVVALQTQDVGLHYQ